MADTASIQITATKDAQGDIDRTALSDAITPHLAGLVAALGVHGFAAADVSIVTAINDETQGQLTGDDPALAPEDGES